MKKNNLQMNNSNASKVGYFLQRLSGMPFAQTYQYANPKSLIVVTGVVSGVLIGVNELLVWVCCILVYSYAVI